MKKMHKGFTLVELLIIIAIIGILSATMMVSVTGSTAKAKANAIANNVASCRLAASSYYGDHIDDGAYATAKTSTAIKAYIATWDDFNSNTITYVADDAATGEGYENWNITIDFSHDADYVAIAEHLAKIKGFGNYGVKKGGDGDDKDDPADAVVSSGKFKVVLWTGVVKAAE